MSWVENILIGLACLLGPGVSPDCLTTANRPAAERAESRILGNTTEQTAPALQAGAIKPELSARAVLVWEEGTDRILYEENSRTRRPVASLSKLLAVLTARRELALQQRIEISPAVAKAQREGADIELKPGDQTTVAELLEAGLIASANDAMVALAVGGFGSEAALVERANFLAREHGWIDTKVSNATGLEGGDQYSTAFDIKQIFQAVWQDPVLGDWLDNESGQLITANGKVINYRSTNELLNTYLPIIAAKTGYTVEAGENLVIMTENEDGVRIGAIILGSDQRFADMKALIGWIWRNYEWPARAEQSVNKNGEIN